MTDIIKKISNRWFLTEPLLFMTFMSHEVTPNAKLRFPVRSGKGRIEYNFGSDNKKLSENEMEENLRAEIIRILLRHPYRRHEKKDIAYIASNITLNEIYKFNYLKYTASEIWGNVLSHKEMNFEFYYRELLNEEEKNQSAQSEQTDEKTNEEKKDDNDNANDEDSDEAGEDNNSDDEDDEDDEDSDEEDNGDGELENDTRNNGGGSRQDSIGNRAPALECSALWEEDDFMDEKIREIVEWAHNNMQWGTMPGNLIQQLIASLSPKIDYRKIINSFRASVLKSDNVLTRFRPSRRFGFLYMGKKNQFSTNLLIAVDVSGSISDKELIIFYSVINRFFKYGIRSIDVIQFDTEIKPPLVTFKKAKKNIKVIGRGGTDFQPAIEFFENERKKHYDGLIIFTDGYAPAPNMKQRTIRKTLWICSNKDNYDSHEQWMKKHGRCCWVEY